MNRMYPGRIDGTQTDQASYLILIGLLLVASVVTAQLPARDQPPTSGSGTGVIRGRVVRSDTGEPLRRVQVRVDEWSTKDLGFGVPPGDYVIVARFDTTDLGSRHGAKVRRPSRCRRARRTPSI